MGKRIGARGCVLLEQRVLSDCLNAKQKEISFLKDITSKHFTTMPRSLDTENLLYKVFKRNWMRTFIQKS